MTKFVFVTDQHFRNKTPINRTDDILESLLKKMEWVFKYCDKHCIPNLIFGGDLFHTSSPIDYVANEVSHLIARYADTMTIYYVIGNHDLIGNNLEKVNYSKIGLMGIYPWFKHITDYPYEFDDCWLCGYDFTKEMDCPEIIDPRQDFDINNKIGSKKRVICVIHSMLVDDKQIVIDGKMKTIHWNAINTTADVILTGHYHPGWGIKENPFGVIFCNPGAMIRGEASKTELKRKPKIAVITVDGNDVKVKLEVIPHDRNVFNIDKLDNKTAAQDEKNKFIEALHSLGDEDMMSTNVLEILESKKLKKKCSKKVIKMCSDKIKELIDK